MLVTIEDWVASAMTTPLFATVSGFFVLTSLVLNFYSWRGRGGATPLRLSTICFLAHCLQTTCSLAARLARLRAARVHVGHRLIGQMAHACECRVLLAECVCARFPLFSLTSTLVSLCPLSWWWWRWRWWCYYCCPSRWPRPLTPTQFPRYIAANIPTNFVAFFSFPLQQAFSILGPPFGYSPFPLPFVLFSCF